MPGRVLIIAYFFPPVAGAGVFRPLKFVKYLPHFGWSPHILTVADDPAWPHDATLLKDIPEGVPVARIAPHWDFRRIDEAIRQFEGLRGVWRLRSFLDWLKIPDDKISWVVPGYRRARSLIRTQHIDVIYTTSYPYCSHLMGYWLKRNTRVPWVADFRDEWAQNPHLRHPTPVHRWLTGKMERLVVGHADHVCSISQPITSMLKNGTRGEEKFTTITNGFDEDDIVAARSRAGGRRDGVFRLVYTGTFYGQRSPTHFITALEQLLEKGLIAPEEIRVRLIGQVGENCLIRPVWRKILECPGYLGHVEALTEIQRADCLLLFIPTQHGAGGYTGKIFEYIASGKPILALVPPAGVAADLIRRSCTGFVVDADDVSAIQATLLELFTKWKAGKLAIRPDEQVIACHERRSLTSQLAAILDRLRDSRKCPLRSS